MPMFGLPELGLQDLGDSIKLKRLAAGWDNDKLEKLLSSIVLV